jgi:small subunit ribosomal protein S1
LKKQLDEELGDELEAALADFDQLTDEDLGFVPSAPTLPTGGSDDDRGPDEPDAVRTGRVVAVRGDDVFVDLGGKSEGVVSARSFTDKEEPVPAVGSPIEVVVDHFDRDSGILILGRKGAAVDANWENLREGLVVEARVTGTNKGGLEVEVGGIRGFIPAGQIDVVHVPEFSDYVGQKFDCVVTEAHREKRNLVLSRRAILERQRAEQREKTWQELEEGQVRDGVVRSIKPFGAFVEIDGVDGLLHVSQMSWSRVEDPAAIVQLGQRIQVQVVKINRETRKVGLGLKQLMASPWDDVETKYPPTSQVTGKVTRIADFGAFVELEPGVEGLIHISELSPQRVHRVRDFVEEGQEVTVVVLGIDHERKRISLSLKAALAAAAEAEAAAPDEEQPIGGESPAPPPLPRKTPLKGGLERME